LNRFKNIALIIITLAFLFESSDVLMTIDLCVHRFMAQEESQDLSSANLTHFTFTNTDFSNLNWTDGKKEFELNHKRFDVASIKHFQNKVIVFAKSDEKENILLSLLDNFHKNTRQNKVFLKFHKNIIPVKTTTLYSLLLSSVETYYTSHSVYSEPVNLFSPPPNFC
jgi:hypothetical protein